MHLFGHTLDHDYYFELPGEEERDTHSIARFSTAHHSRCPGCPAGVEEAVMESTAQYWRSVWLELEPYMRLHLAHAFSNRAPRGRKHDFKDAERLVRRLIAKELILSFVPDEEQRTWRSLTRMKLQLTRDRVRLQNQMECLLEEMRIQLSIVVSNLLGASGLRILRAWAKGETDPKKLAQLGDERLQCTEEQLVDALTGRVQPLHRAMLGLQLERLQLIDRQIAKLNALIAQAMKPHQEAEMRLAEVPGPPKAINICAGC